MVSSGPLCQCELAGANLSRVLEWQQYHSPAEVTSAVIFYVLDCIHLRSTWGRYRGSWVLQDHRSHLKDCPPSKLIVRSLKGNGKKKLTLLKKENIDQQKKVRIHHLHDISKGLTWPVASVWCLHKLIYLLQQSTNFWFYLLYDWKARRCEVNVYVGWGFNPSKKNLGLL
jgi:hypothetical protein